MLKPLSHELRRRAVEISLGFLALYVAVDIGVQLYNRIYAAKKKVIAEISVHEDVLDEAQADSTSVDPAFDTGFEDGPSSPEPNSTFEEIESIRNLQTGVQITGFSILGEDQTIGSMESFSEEEPTDVLIHFEPSLVEASLPVAQEEEPTSPILAITDVEEEYIEASLSEISSIPETDNDNSSITSTDEHFLSCSEYEYFSACSDIEVE
ncbi:Oidioi.mRNA.OKI2018_I69.chr1.g1930.t1.cds [Oikopleura dioica]|uniref:Oidioi.mRNA.OKI2018_I69.chr1.g1930.t1.cds n=1 Tax=Oikopleura dioica TaxID=34765 RepID=A0ABN7SSZ2_OIKDI|nr:Oidioi.mRNA.OKI2018_I69.chr1.g1930.t1.cds [Oikopleura dioica]